MLYVLGCLGILLLTIAGYAVGTYIVMWAWNLALVPLFGWTPIEPIQTFAIIIILSMLGRFFKDTTTSKR